MRQSFIYWCRSGFWLLSPQTLLTGCRQQIAGAVFCLLGSRTGQFCQHEHKTAGDRFKTKVLHEVSARP